MTLKSKAEALRLAAIKDRKTHAAADDLLASWFKSDPADIYIIV
jgi:hypothetical protein